MKKLIDAVDDVVVDALAGMALAHPESLSVDLEHRLVLRTEPKAEGRVAILSGGGSGHEPLHGGFVGHGMLDAACAGEVFTSPVPDQMAAAIAAVDRGAGVLQVVKNYTGDVMNFEMAAELAVAESGTEVRSVITNDDVAVEDSTFTAGRRGVGGTVLVEKIAGAAAEEGRDLEQVTEIATRVNERARSMGVALTSVTVPANGKPSFELGEDEIEVGIGIHGEPGRHREKLVPAKDVARRLLEPILAELPGEGPVLLFVNGMGGTPLLELYILAKDAHEVLAEAGVEVSRHLVGNYITSLDMAGASITLLRLDEELTALWDAPVSTPALRRGL
ncbi:dihydroxyacetone kinase subunit DhaK [Brachybacterium saurashtrense]|uniref:Dihydroxyacetone kinase subunit DhaK n=1 Tax=Brachybacterium saurashtrense TaxID=556288 RepID=A0A345YSB9_9MICO|nr:dihydroxyacetone kinase subunit DhaK [Brachybacterium saurashtrense]AXK46821.1 dihydroxyacetone kinase subunit DhaK [Brachybacterium saurashtrense]RRR22536.1 dihydroxyacetone kinase subunit DhaK [Brachybacterium saurashtrense]